MAFIKSSHNTFINTITIFFPSHQIHPGKWYFYRQDNTTCFLFTSPNNQTHTFTISDTKIGFLTIKKTNSHNIPFSQLIALPHIKATIPSDTTSLQIDIKEILALSNIQNYFLNPTNLPPLPQIDLFSQEINII